MIDATRRWWKQPGASPAVIRDLVDASPVGLPDEYLDLLRFSNGGEGPLEVQPYNCCLDTAEYVAAALRRNAHAEFFPGFLIFGGNGGGEFLAMDIRGSSPWPIVALDMCNCDLGQSLLHVANDFSQLIGYVGVTRKDQ